MKTLYSKRCHVLFCKHPYCGEIRIIIFFEDALPVSLRSELFTSFILTILKL